jgi:3-hydroxyisobutyrate dehydrogenase-like beta-hydroxyacid dehydrogenase
MCRRLITAVLALVFDTTDRQTEKTKATEACRTTTHTLAATRATDMITTTVMDQEDTLTTVQSTDTTALRHLLKQGR